MLLEIGNVTTKVRRATRDEIRWLIGYLTFRDEKNAFRKVRGRAKPEWVKPPKIPLFDLADETFPTGFLPLVVVRTREAGLVVEVVDGRSELPPERPEADLSWLRPYQLEAVLKASGATRGIIHAPTSSGKTEMMIGLTRQRPCRWLALAHRSGLMGQLADRYGLRNHEAGLPERAVRFEDYDGIAGPLTVTTFQMLRDKVGSEAFQEFADQIEGLIVDECHTLPADSHAKVAMSFYNAGVRFGFSGTPLARDDKRSLVAVGALGPVIYRISAQELIKQGHVADSLITMVPCEQTSDRPTYQGVYGETIVRSSVRNKLLVRIVKELADKPAILFIKELKHGHNLMRLLQRTGLGVRFVQGQLAEKQREQVQKSVNRGDLDVVVASVVWQEGVDIPSLRSVIVGTGGKSVIAALQRLGRGGRPGKDKQAFQLWDIWDHGHRFLEDHSRARIAAYRSEGYEPVIKEV